MTDTTLDPTIRGRIDYTFARLLRFAESDAGDCPIALRAPHTYQAWVALSYGERRAHLLAAITSEKIERRDHERARYTQGVNEPREVLPMLAPSRVPIVRPAIAQEVRPTSAHRYVVPFATGCGELLAARAHELSSATAMDTSRAAEERV